ncbi:hypothetical protein MITS9509_01286 [Synechococcus sp. MIT S9509]|nr:hypothetical protein MITS9509_01286 [Synechococcus sp. MIT S9509]
MTSISSLETTTATLFSSAIPAQQVFPPSPNKKGIHPSALRKLAPLLAQTWSISTATAISISSSATTTATLSSSAIPAQQVFPPTPNKKGIHPSGYRMLAIQPYQPLPISMTMAILISSSARPRATPFSSATPPPHPSPRLTQQRPMAPMASTMSLPSPSASQNPLSSTPLAAHQDFNSKPVAPIVTPPIPPAPAAPPSPSNTPFKRVTPPLISISSPPLHSNSMAAPSRMLQATMPSLPSRLQAKPDPLATMQFWGSIVHRTSLVPQPLSPSRKGMAPKSSTPPSPSPISMTPTSNRPPSLSPPVSNPQKMSSLSPIPPQSQVPGMNPQVS